MSSLNAFAKRIESALGSVSPAASSWLQEVSASPGMADAEAERRFPDEARDSSVKNAYRHALGAGRLAQLLGSTSDNPIVAGAARGAAKIAGYGWEGLGFRDGTNNWNSLDFRHDLNANAQGITQSSQAKDFRSLADQLDSFARGARKELPPAPTERARPYFTYTE